MNPLFHIRLSQFQEESLNFVFKEFNILNSHKGEFCKVCGITQGMPHDGFNPYFCDHLTNKINKKLKKENKKIIKFLLDALDTLKQDVQVEV